MKSKKNIEKAEQQILQKQEDIYLLICAFFRSFLAGLRVGLLFHNTLFCALFYTIVFYLLHVKKLGQKFLKSPQTLISIFFTILTNNTLDGFDFMFFIIDLGFSYSIAGILTYRIISINTLKYFFICVLSTLYNVKDHLQKVKFISVFTGKLCMYVTFLAQIIYAIYMLYSGMLKNFNKYDNIRFPLIHGVFIYCIKNKFLINKNAKFKKNDYLCSLYGFVSLVAVILDAVFWTTLFETRKNLIK